MKGKIIQIISHKENNKFYKLTVLCDDGKIWTKENIYPYAWIEIDTKDFTHKD